MSLKISKFLKVINVALIHTSTYSNPMYNSMALGIVGSKTQQLYRANKDLYRGAGNV